MLAMTPETLAKYFDHTLLRADARRADFEALCADARRYGFHMVAINPAPVALCKRLLEGSGVRVGAAIGFPLGQSTIRAKRFETADALQNGANEIDYVVNIQRLKDGDKDYVASEMREIVDLCRERGAASKVIFETCYLSGQEKETLCEIALQVGPDFIKTSTGFGSGGATTADISLMKRMVGDHVKVKASGGIRTLDMVLELIGLGVERIGSSSSRKIIDAYRERCGTGYQDGSLCD